MNNENKINLLIKKGQDYQKNHDYFRKKQQRGYTFLLFFAKKGVVLRPPVI